MTRQFIAIIEREGDGFVALCPELDVASQGDTIEGAARQSPGGDRAVPRNGDAGRDLQGKRRHARQAQR